MTDKILRPKELLIPPKNSPLYLKLWTKIYKYILTKYSKIQMRKSHRSKKWGGQGPPAPPVAATAVISCYLWYRPWVCNMIRCFSSIHSFPLSTSEESVRKCVSLRSRNCALPIQLRRSVGSSFETTVNIYFLRKFSSAFQNRYLAMRAKCALSCFINGKPERILMKLDYAIL